MGILGSELLGSELHATFSDFGGKGFVVGSEVGSDSHTTGYSLLGSEGSEGSEVLL